MAGGHHGPEFDLFSAPPISPGGVFFNRHRKEKAMATTKSKHTIAVIYSSGREETLRPKNKTEAANMIADLLELKSSGLVKNFQHKVDAPSAGKGGKA